jgi:predicted lipid-binding transport protein (Tim44 family)
MLLPIVININIRFTDPSHRRRRNNKTGDYVNNTKHLTAMALAAVILGASMACQTADNKNAAVNQSANKVVTNANAPTNSSTPEPASDPSSNASGTPTAAYKAAYEARKNKDVAALKKLLSKDILKFFTEIGALGDKKQSLNEMLMELCEKPQAATAEVRNEKITGDKASIEYLDEKGGWSPMEFIKEDGAWKLTIDKLDNEDPEDRKGNTK